MALALLEDMKQPIICYICEKHIEPMPREIPVAERAYKSDVIISRDAYWNDAGIFTIMHTRRFFHKKCFEDALYEHKLKMVKEDNRVA